MAVGMVPVKPLVGGGEGNKKAVPKGLAPLLVINSL